VFGCFSNGSHKNLRQQLDKLGFCLVEGDIRDKVDVRKALDVVDVCPRVTEKREGLYAMLTMSS